MATYQAQLKDPSNVAVLNGIRSNASTEYASRIPEATRSNIQVVLNALTQNLPAWNEFEGALINRIGSVIARNYTWDNPLKEFKRGMLEYGDTIEEYSVGLLKSHTYDPDMEFTGREIWKQEKPEAKSLFHKIDRQEYYKVTVNQDLLRRAFLQPNGLSEYVSNLMRAPIESDNWDEFMLMCSLFGEYERRGGYWHVQVPDLNSLQAGEADAKYLLKAIRKYTGELKFRRPAYNAAGMPIGANSDELVLFASPDVTANISVEALASAFNMPQLEVQSRIIQIPQDEFHIPGVQAILTTKDFFVVADSLIANNSIYNPAGLYNNYFFHHHEVLSCSLFAPAIMFWTGDSDELTPRILGAALVDPDKPISLRDIEDNPINASNKAEASGVYRASVTKEVFDERHALEPTNVIWGLAGATDSRTSISQTGVLKIGPAEQGTLQITARVSNEDSKIIDGGAVKSVSLEPGVMYWPGGDEANAIASKPVNSAEKAVVKESDK